MNGNNFFDFTRRIIDANRADRSVNSADWIAALVRISGKPGLGRTIATFIDRGSADPAGDLAGLLREAGIPFTLNERGVPQL
jgi:transposase InsO family protein